MKRESKIIGCLLITIFLISSGCKKEEFTWGIKVGDITFSGNVVFLGPTELALLKNVATDEIVFSEKTGEIGKITDMSILVMGVSEKTPYGSLRKVKSIQTSGSDIIINTSNALLSDAIKEGTVNLQVRLMEKNFKLKSKIDGVLVKGANKSFDGLAVTLDNFEAFREGTRIARFNGSIGASPEIRMTIKIASNRINEINVMTTLNKIDELSVVSNGAFNGTREFKAAEFSHTPIIIDSLVFVPEVSIICGFDGTVLSEVSSGVRQDRVINSQMSYLDSKWSKSPLTHTQSFDFVRPQLTDNSNMKIYSGPEITLNLFGIQIQTMKATGFYLLDANKTTSPLWKLSIGNDGHHTVKSELLGSRFDFTSSLAIQTQEIGNANSK